MTAVVQALYAALVIAMWLVLAKLVVGILRLSAEERPDVSQYRQAVLRYALAGFATGFAAVALDMWLIVNTGSGLYGFWLTAGPILLFGTVGSPLAWRRVHRERKASGWAESPF